VLVAGNRRSLPEAAIFGILLDQTNVIQVPLAANKR
jgi:hypothetical protein